MEYKFEEVFNIPELQKLCESFTQINDIVTALLDLEGKVYISTGWKQICTQFHRKHTICSKECTLSDTLLANKAKNKSRYNMYKCKNGLIDVAIPIYIKKEHVGNFFTGQFLLAPLISIFSVSSPNVLALTNGIFNGTQKSTCHF